MIRQSRAALLCAALLLSACGQQSELRQNLDEEEANDVLATLDRYGIVARKEVRSDSFTIRVDASDFTRAVEILREEGQPAGKRATLGSVFRKEGMVSTPLEERARYLYALSQELERTLQQMDGVLVARVHVVLPERVAPGEPLTVASAAVFIKYRPDAALDLALPRINRLVAHSLPGLANAGPSGVSVVLSPAAITQTPMPPQQVDAARRQREVRRWFATGAFVIGLVLSSIAGAWYVMQRTSFRLRGRSPGKHDAPTTDA
ncbi:type III secretion system inner membrane ring lipoprotein SctJ [Trinickia mobilis]|uniref:type III secretion system inner membrane ring lipoprotein SctJ n=1 Tax=Trinickia mobilis TaxID=2816356 RepID=UPI001A8EED64|nr:type III secretion inner membrane ring lipoprotein SctJ [Trinickia mobilis]